MNFELGYGRVSHLSLKDFSDGIFGLAGLLGGNRIEFALINKKIIDNLGLLDNKNTIHDPAVYSFHFLVAVSCLQAQI